MYLNLPFFLFLGFGLASYLLIDIWREKPRITKIKTVAIMMPNCGPLMNHHLPFSKAAYDFYAANVDESIIYVTSE